MHVRAMDDFCPAPNEEALQEASEWQISLEKLSGMVVAHGCRKIGTCEEKISVWCENGRYHIYTERIDHGSAAYGWAPQKIAFTPDAHTLALLKSRAECATK